jgi:beta-glucosidase
METLGMGQDIDPSVSPVGSIDTNTTPDTEFSPPGSPFHESAPSKDKRLLARKKLGTLTLEEKVSCTVTPFLRRQKIDI